MRQREFEFGAASGRLKPRSLSMPQSVTPGFRILGSQVQSLTLPRVLTRAWTSISFLVTSAGKEYTIFFATELPGVHSAWFFRIWIGQRRRVVVDFGCLILVPCGLGLDAGLWFTPSRMSQEHTSTQPWAQLVKAEARLRNPFLFVCLFRVGCSKSRKSTPNCPR